MYTLNISYKQFYITLNDIWLYESDPNAPSICSKPGGKQWQHSIRGWHNLDCSFILIFICCQIFWNCYICSVIAVDIDFKENNCSTNEQPLIAYKKVSIIKVIAWPFLLVQSVFFTWWHHQMETFSTSLALSEGNPPVTSGFPSQRQWCGALMSSLICSWRNSWAHKPDAGDLRHHRAHYDLTVMEILKTGTPWLTECVRYGVYVMSSKFDTCSTLIALFSIFVYEFYM